MATEAELKAWNELQAYRAERDAEWGQWVAADQIWHDGALAYDAGQPVPVSNVQRHRYDMSGQVRRVERTEPSGDPAGSITEGA